MSTRVDDRQASNGHPSLLTHAAAATRPARTRTRGRIRRSAGRAWAAVRPLSLSLISLSALDAALWVLPIGPWAVVAGLAGVGVGGLLLDRQVHG